MSINTLIIDGNATRDAELRTTQTGKKVLSFGLANNRRFGDSEEVNFIDCTLFGDRAEKLAPYIQKGTGLVLQGHIHYSEWERDGAKRSKLELIVDNVTFKGSRKSAEEATPEAEDAGDVYGEDIPF